MTLHPGEYAELIRQRQLRRDDEQVRLALGLHPDHLQYGPYGTPPRWVYRGRDGATYIQARLGEYTQLTPPIPVAAIDSGWAEWELLRDTINQAGG